MDKKYVIEIHRKEPGCNPEIIVAYIDSNTPEEAMENARKLNDKYATEIHIYEDARVFDEYGARYDEVLYCMMYRGKWEPINSTKQTSIWRDFETGELSFEE